MSEEPNEQDQNSGDGGALEDRVVELVSELGSPGGERRERARRELVEIGSPATRALIAALGAPEKQMRWEAASTLGAIGDAAAGPALARRLEDPEPDVRWAAAAALIELGAAALEPVLEALVVQPYSIGLRESARHVLQTLYRKGHDGRLDGVREALLHVTSEEAIHVEAFDALLALRGET